MTERPSRNIPKAMAAQYIIGFATAFVYMVAIFYSIHALPGALSSTPIFPLAGLYGVLSSDRHTRRRTRSARHCLHPDFHYCHWLLHHGRSHILDLVPRQRHPFQPCLSPSPPPVSQPIHSMRHSSAAASAQSWGASTWVRRRPLMHLSGPTLSFPLCHISQPFFRILPMVARDCRVGGFGWVAQWGSS